MSITIQPPRTIWLGGPGTQVGNIAAGEVLTPGHLIELYNSSGTMLYRKHAATGAVAVGATFCMEQSMLNKGTGPATGTPPADGTVTIPIGDLVEAVVGVPGTTVWAIIASGQNITKGDYLESAGNGTLRVFSSGAKIGQALESIDARAVTQAYIRTELS